jgi:hypothetical protein
MLQITKTMINVFKITDMDFMGYHLNKDEANYHHLIIPRRNSGPKSIRNGAVLNANTSHPYLHIVEERDYELFFLITRELIKENYLGRLDDNAIRKIDDYLTVFERENSGAYNFVGNPLIREEYTIRMKR